MVGNTEILSLTTRTTSALTRQKTAKLKLKLVALWKNFSRYRNNQKTEQEKKQQCWVDSLTRDRAIKSTRIWPSTKARTKTSLCANTGVANIDVLTKRELNKQFNNSTVIVIELDNLQQYKFKFPNRLKLIQSVASSINLITDARKIEKSTWWKSKRHHVNHFGKLRKTNLASSKVWAAHN